MLYAVCYGPNLAHSQLLQNRQTFPPATLRSCNLLLVCQYSPFSLISISPLSFTFLHPCSDEPLHILTHPHHLSPFPFSPVPISSSTTNSRTRLLSAHPFTQCVRLQPRPSKMSLLLTHPILRTPSQPLMISSLPQFSSRMTLMTSLAVETCFLAFLDDGPAYLTR